MSVRMLIASGRCLASASQVGARGGGADVGVDDVAELRDEMDGGNEDSEDDESGGRVSGESAAPSASEDSMVCCL